MKKIAKRVLAAVLSAVVGVCAIGIGVFAESIYDTAVELPSGEEQSFTLGSSWTAQDYKVTLTQKGTLEIKINSSLQWSYLCVFDADGYTLAANEADLPTGNADICSDDVRFTWNGTTENFKGTVKYELDAGTYYIRYYRDYTSGSGKTTFTATYPSGSSNSTSASEGKISYLAIQMETGDTLSLGVVAKPADAQIEWSSSRSSVASVSESGEVTALKPGTTVITAKCGKSYKKIKIYVV